MIIEFFESRYHPDELKEHEKFSNGKVFKGEFTTKSSIDIKEVKHFGENPMKVNGESVPCTDVVLKSGAYSTLLIPYKKFKVIWEYVNKKKVLRQSEILQKIIKE